MILIAWSYVGSLFVAVLVLFRGGGVGVDDWESLCDCGNSDGNRLLVPGVVKRFPRKTRL